MTKALLARGWADFRAHWRAPLAFHLLMQLLGAAMFTPLATWVGRRLVLASGAPVISNFDIAGFVLSPAGAASVLVIAALVVALLLAEFTGLGFIAGHAIARRRVTVSSTIAFVLRSLPRLFLLSARVFLRLCVLALPFLAVAGLVWFTMLRGHDINYYLAEQPPAWKLANLIVVILASIYALLAAWQLARWLYAVPILAFEGAAPAQALRDSARMTRGRIARTVRPLVLWWPLLTAAAATVTWTCRHLSDAGLDWAGIDVYRVLPLVAVYLAITFIGGLVYGGLHLSGHQFLVTRMYAEQRGLGQRLVPAAPESVDERARIVARPVIAATLAMLAVALAAGAFLAS